MEISDYIICALDNVNVNNVRNQEMAMLFACIAVDGSAQRKYNPYNKVKKMGNSFRKFINENIDVIQFMLGDFDISGRNIPIIENNKVVNRDTFAQIVYEKYRCNLAHGKALYDFGIESNNFKSTSTWSIGPNSLEFPRSISSALGLACVLDEVNKYQQIRFDNKYHYNNDYFYFKIDNWWGAKKKMLDITQEYRKSQKLISFNLLSDSINNIETREKIYKEKLNITQSNTLEFKTITVKNNDTVVYKINICDKDNKVINHVTATDSISSDSQDTRKVDYIMQNINGTTNLIGKFNYELN